jgi:hypothetical protein
VALSQLSWVQGLPSSQTLGMGLHPTLGSQFGSRQYAVGVGQTTATGGSQVKLTSLHWSVVHRLPSSQPLSAFGQAQLAPSQEAQEVGTKLHPEAGLHEATSQELFATQLTLVKTHALVVGSHVPVWQALEEVQTMGGAMHWPVVTSHESFVQGIPSSQGKGVYTQLPLLRLQAEVKHGRGGH